MARAGHCTQEKLEVGIPEVKTTSNRNKAFSFFSTGYVLAMGKFCCPARHAQVCRVSGGSSTAILSKSLRMVSWTLEISSEEIILTSYYCRRQFK